MQLGQTNDNIVQVHISKYMSSYVMRQTHKHLGHAEHIVI